MRAFATSRGILGNPEIGQFLDAEVVKAGSVEPDAGDIAVGWGFKKNTGSIRAFAAENDLPFVSLEDGFYSYLGHPARDPRRLSLIADKTGVYYDARSPSDLEEMLNSSADLDAAATARANGIAERIRVGRLSKYNHAPVRAGEALAGLATDADCVLVVDQTAGDVSIEAGCASAESFAEMLQVALDENPDSKILVKVHPDVLLGTKKGHFGDHLPDRCHLVADAVSPWALFDLVSRVYVVSSQMGFEALLAGLPVVTFGVPFYAGWGLTDDRADKSLDVWARRGRKLDLAHLVDAAIVRYPRYRDPFVGEACAVERVLDLLEAEKAIARPAGKTAWMVGFSVWKKRFVDAFVQGGFDRVRFVSVSKAGRLEPDANDAVIVWGRREPELVARLEGYCPVWHMEDGFIRSVGLGVDLSRPASLVLDRRGLYFDATRPSDLECFLSAFEFRDWHKAAGERFLAAMKAASVSKYNVGSKQAVDIRVGAGEKQVLLVCGQVEGDASLQFGASEVCTNARLLQSVREENPDAWIVYKPHPDVVAGDRQGAVPANVLETVDLVLEGSDISLCIDQADHVHVMTSLAGFEALVRGKAVTTWGSPFYAGWGLVTSKAELPARGRQLTLPELVYGAYMVYPRYVSWPSGAATTATATLQAMAAARRQRAEHADMASFSGGWWRKAANLIEAFFK